MVLEKNLVIDNCIGYGTFSDVYECFCEYDYLIYKKYIRKDITKLIHKKMMIFKDYYYDPKIVFPRDFVFAKKNSLRFNGILFDCESNFHNLEFFDILSFDKKKELLYKIRDLIEYYHKTYKLVHADIHPGNLIYNFECDSIKLIDLDSSIYLEDKSGYLKQISNILTNEYINYYGINFELDIYLFNLLTLSFLNNWNFCDIRKNINRENNYLFKSNNHINKIVNDYRNIGTQKKLKKEYIIDYI